VQIPAAYHEKCSSFALCLLNYSKQADMVICLWLNMTPHLFDFPFIHTMTVDLPLYYLLICCVPDTQLISSSCMVFSSFSYMDYSSIVAHSPHVSKLSKDKNW